MTLKSCVYGAGLVWFWGRPEPPLPQPKLVGGQRALTCRLWAHQQSRAGWELGALGRLGQVYLLKKINPSKMCVAGKVVNSNLHPWNKVKFALNRSDSFKCSAVLSGALSSSQVTKPAQVTKAGQVTKPGQPLCHSLCRAQLCAARANHIPASHTVVSQSFPIPSIKHNNHNLHYVL